MSRQDVTRQSANDGGGRRRLADWVVPMAPLAIMAVVVGISVMVGHQGLPERQQKGPPPAPGAAPAIEETRYGDWRVRCVAQGSQRRCTAVTERFDPATGLRLLALEFMPSDVDLSGIMVLPFGLKVTEDVTFRLAETQLGQHPFRTCLPDGCIVPVLLRQEQRAALVASPILTVRVRADSGETVDLAVPLGGFAGALDAARSGSGPTP